MQHQETFLFPQAKLVEKSMRGDHKQQLRVVKPEWARFSGAC
jgi:hypothetical protein